MEKTEKSVKSQMTMRAPKSTSRARLLALSVVNDTPFYHEGCVWKVVDYREKDDTFEFDLELLKNPYA